MKCKCGCEIVEYERYFHRTNRGDVVKCNCGCKNPQPKEVKE